MREKVNDPMTGLKRMYLYTILGAGVFGLGLLVAPGLIKIILLGWKVTDPIAIGIIASTFLAFALLSVLGLRSPLLFAPILLLQMLYKIIWFLAVFLPLSFRGELSLTAIVVAMIFASYIAGDMLALPFKTLFLDTSEKE